jgi:hypothetical protein
MKKITNELKQSIRTKLDAEELYAERINIIRVEDQTMIFGTLNYNIEKFLDIIYKIDKQCLHAHFIDKVHGVISCKPIMVKRILRRYEVLEKDGHIFDKKPLLDCIKAIEACI